MAKFQFRLETLRKIRMAHRDEMRGKLADASKAVQMLGEQQQAIVQEILAIQAAQRQAATGGSPDLNSLLESQRYQAVLRAQQVTMDGQAKQLEAEVERRRQVVVEADRQVKVLDKLEQRQKTNYQEEMTRKETKLLDEIASLAREVET